MTPGSSILPLAPGALQENSEWTSQGPSEELVGLSHYLWLLRRFSVRITLAVLLVAGVCFLYCAMSVPRYEATARVLLDESSPGTAIGEISDSIHSSDEQMINTQIQMIQSDAVLRPVAKQYHLTNSEPAFKFSLWGNKAKPAPEVAESAAPVVLRYLTVDRIPNNLLINIHYTSTDPDKAALIANAIALSYIKHMLTMRAASSSELSQFMETQIDELKASMDKSSTALSAFERQMGVIDPEEKTSVLSARLLQLNTQFLTAQNDRFKAESAYNQLRANLPGTTQNLAGAALEISPQAIALGRQEDQLHSAEERLAVAATTYGVKHQEYQRALGDVNELKRQTSAMREEIMKRIEAEYHQASAHEDMLHSELDKAKAESDQLNVHSAQYQELKREVEANTTLYNELFKKIKEAGINAGFQGSSIRVADMARPLSGPVYPRTVMATTIAGLLTFLGMLAAIVGSDIFDRTLRDPGRAMKLTGTDVLGFLPHVHNFVNVYNPPQLAESDLSPSSKRWMNSQAFYRESIFTLLATLSRVQHGHAPASILITSADSGDGKSCCAASLAMANAQLGKRTLLIDADLRSPFQHRYFDQPNKAGLSEAISEGRPLVEASRRIEGTSCLDLVVAGERDPIHYNQVGNKVAQLLAQAKAAGYDLVIVDAPPMLGLSEPLEIACSVDGVLVVANAHVTTDRQVIDVIYSLRRVRASVLGIVLNRFRPMMSPSYGGYAGYSNYIASMAD
jgi:succinoglycan biosynthesis transport protein ExoP